MAERRKSRSSGSSKKSTWSDSIDHRDPQWDEKRTYQLVCGLNVSSNLRVLSVGENSAKSNRFLPWRTPAGWPPPEEPGDWAWFLHPDTHEWVFTQWLGSLWWELSRTSCGEFYAGKNRKGKPLIRKNWISPFAAMHEERRQNPELDAKFREQCRENGRRTGKRTGPMNKGRRHSPEVNASKGRRGTENAVFGKKRITNGTENRWHDPSLPLPPGWRFGLTRRARPSP